MAAIVFAPPPAFADFGDTALTGVAADATPAAIIEWGVNDAARQRPRLFGLDVRLGSG